MSRILTMHYYYYWYSFWVFYTSVSRWFLTRCWVTASHLKSPGLFSLFSDHSNAVVWMVSIRHLISKSSSSCTNPLVIVPRAPIIIGITVTFMLHRFFNSLAKSRYWSFFSLSFNFTLLWLQSPQFGKFFIIIIIIIIRRSGRLAEIWWSACISKSRRSLCVSFFRTDSGLYIYHFFA